MSDALSLETTAHIAEQTIKDTAQEVQTTAISAVRTLDIRREFSLDFLGEAWKECKIFFRPFTTDEIRESIVAHAKEDIEDLIEKAKSSAETLGEMTEVLKKHFVDGTVVVDGKVTPALKEDMHLLPGDATRKAFQLVVGAVDPNSQAPSNPS